MQEKNKHAPKGHRRVGDFRRASCTPCHPDKWIPSAVERKPQLQVVVAVVEE